MVLLVVEGAYRYTVFQTSALWGDEVRDARNALVGAILVFTAYYLGTAIVSLSGAPIPGPLMGLLLLLGLLLAFPQLEVHTARFVTFPLKHMSLLFVPAVLGVSIYWPDIQANGLAIVIAIVVTTSLSLGMTAWITQRLLNKKRGTDNAESVKTDGSNV